MNKLGKILAITTGILALWCIFYFIAVPQVLSSEFVKSKIQAEVLRRSGFNLAINNYKFRTGLAPVIRFKAQDILLKNTEKNELILIKNLDTKTNWLALLFGKLSLNRLEAENIEIILTEDYTEKFLSPRIIELIKHINLKNGKLQNLKIDLFNQKLIEDISIQSKDFEIINFNLDKQIAMKTKLNFTEAKNSGEIKMVSNIKLPLSIKNISSGFINININNLNLKTISKSINKLYPEIEKTEGIINLSVDKKNNDTMNFELSSDGLFLKFENKDLPIYQTKPINIKSILSFDKENISINSVKINSDLIKACLFGKIGTKDNKNPDLNLTISIDKSNAQEMIRLTPPSKNLVPELDLEALKRNFFDGNVLAHLEITGKAIRPQLNGSILINDAYLIKPIKNAKKATIKLIFNRDKMNLEVSVPTTPKERVWANGIFDIYDEKRCILSVKSTKNIDLETAQVVVNPLQEVIKIPFGPVPIMKILGIGNIDIKVQGNVQDPHIWGAFNFRNATVSFVDMPNLIIKNGEGDLKFNDTDTYFKTTNASINGRPASIEGSCTLMGVFNFVAISKNQNLGKIFADIKDNTLLGEINNYFAQIESMRGFGDLNLNIYGALKNIHDMEFNKNVFSRGKISLNSVTIKPKAIPQEISNIFGELSLDNKDLLVNLYALINKSKVIMEGKIKDSEANLLIKTKDFRLLDAISTLPVEHQRNILTLVKSNEFLNLIPTLNTDFTAKYKGSVEKIQPNNLEVYGSLYSTDNNAFKKSNYEFSNSTLRFSPIHLKTTDVKFDAGGTISNLFGEKPIFTGNLNLNNFDLNLINISTLKNIVSNSQLTDNLENLTGLINLSANAQNGKINANCKLKDIKIQANKQIHEILNGDLFLRNDIILADNINVRIFDMPVLLNGKFSMPQNKNSNYHIWLNTKPTQEFLNTCFNQKALYPIKVRGDLELMAEITGNQQSTNIKSNLLLDKDSSIYYMGATLGDKANAVRLTSNVNLHNSELKINKFNYDKIVMSLDNNETIVPLLNITGGMTYLQDNLIRFNNLKIKSSMPVDAKIFNIIFRKPFMKEGSFTSDLNLNGTSIKPEVLGKLKITDINIPFVETNINNINFDFLPKTIEVVSTGDLISNKIKFLATLTNNLSLPLTVENLNIHVAQLDLNKITEKIKEIEEANFKMHTGTSVIQPLDYSNFVIKNSEISADTILIDNITATNYLSNVEINNDKILHVKNFEFDMAEGKVNGEITHNYNDNNIKLDLNLEKANSAQIAQTLFNVKNQLFGLANGKISISCNAENEKTCLATLSGTGNFEIADGRMPKLGSVEYLLKAGNLIKNGITGLTINGLVDLLSPLKSGEFKSISGDFVMKDGIAEEINIYSSGKDLNLYLTGNYNLTTAVADFKIFGSLSKNITSVFNKVKNLSINTLIKTIPGIGKESENEFSEELAKIPNANDINSIYKFFRVIINGDINGEDFVKSFEWVGN